MYTIQCKCGNEECNDRIVFVGSTPRMIVETKGSEIILDANTIVQIIRNLKHILNEMQSVD